MLVGVLASSAVVVLLVVGLLVVLRGPSWLPGGADCTVARGDRTVELSTAEAQRAATVAARAVRLRLPVGTAATAIQDLVDLSDQDARVVALALTGRAPHALTCRHGGGRGRGVGPAERLGLTARAEAVRRDLDAAFGRQQLGGFAPGGVTTGHMPGSAHYEGRAVDVFYRPVDAPHNKATGWATAQYLVAHADRLAVEHRHLRRPHLDGPALAAGLARLRPGHARTIAPPSPPSSSTATTCTSTSPTDVGARALIRASLAGEPLEPGLEGGAAVGVAAQLDVRRAVGREQRVVEPAYGAGRVAVVHPGRGSGPRRRARSTSPSSSSEVMPSSSSRPEIQA